MGNSTGSYRTTIKASMKAFDKLPLLVRQALNAACFAWATPPLVRQWKNGNLNSRQMAAQIPKWDDMEIGLQALKVWGPDHPEAIKRGLTRKPVKQKRRRT
jgi:Family of unknown function (DUF6525)